MCRRMVRAVILAVLVLTAAACGVHDHVVLTGRVVGVHAPLRTIYLLDDGDVFALVVDPVTIRVFGPGGRPVPIDEIRPGAEIQAIGRRIGQHYVRAEEIRLHDTQDEVQFRHEDRTGGSTLRKRPAPTLRRDGTRGLGTD